MKREQNGKSYLRESISQINLPIHTELIVHLSALKVKRARGTFAISLAILRNKKV
jgi:hypothetical protein